MKKLIQLAFAATLIFAAQSSFAQVSVSAGTGMFKGEDADGQIGLQMAFNYNVSDKIRIGANLGSYSKSETSGGEKFSYRSMPVALSGEYSFSTEKVSPYVGLDLGIFRVGYSGGGSTEWFDSWLNLAPKAGLNVGLSDSFGLNVHAKYHLLKYEDFSTSGISFNLGVFKNF
jgi:outer membrane protein W